MSTPADEAKIDINVLLNNTDPAARDAAVSDLVTIVKTEGPQAFVRLGLAEAILKGLKDKKKRIRSRRRMLFTIGAVHPGSRSRSGTFRSRSR